jgi:NADP-dependent 3-hydroxy acid dehydrogenase YdfG
MDDSEAGRKQGKRVVVVTGASAGVGRAIVRELARTGDDVALLARDEHRLEAARAEVESLGQRALVCPVDVADADAVEAAAERIERELGPIDAWINNAMVSVFSPVREMTAEEYRRVTEVTYLGYVHGTLSALRRMLGRDRGCIVQVGSALAYRGIPLQSAYCAGKFAVRGFTDSLRTELLHDDSNVQVTQVHLPAVNTPQFAWVRSKLPNEAQPVPPIYQPEVAARAIVWASRNPQRRELLVGVPTWRTIIGNKLVPGVADRFLARSGFEDQQTDERREEDHPDNLYDPAPGSWAAHGEFDECSREHSWVTEASKHRGLIAAGAALAAGAATIAARR